jgi:hypothetical protein
VEAERKVYVILAAEFFKHLDTKEVEPLLRVKASNSEYNPFNRGMFGYRIGDHEVKGGYRLYCHQNSWLRKFYQNDNLTEIVLSKLNDANTESKIKLKNREKNFENYAKSKNSEIFIKKKRCTYPLRDDEHRDFRCAIKICRGCYLNDQNLESCERRPLSEFIFHCHTHRGGLHAHCSAKACGLYKKIVKIEPQSIEIIEDKGITIFRNTLRTTVDFDSLYFLPFEIAGIVRNTRGKWEIDSSDKESRIHETFKKDLRPMLNFFNGLLPSLEDCYKRRNIIDDVEQISFANFFAKYENLCKNK